MLQVRQNSLCWFWQLSFSTLAIDIWCCNFQHREHYLKGKASTGEETNILGWYMLRPHRKISSLLSNTHTRVLEVCWCAILHIKIVILCSSHYNEGFNSITCSYFIWLSPTIGAHMILGSVICQNKLFKSTFVQILIIPNHWECEDSLKFIFFLMCMLNLLL